MLTENMNRKQFLSLGALSLAGLGLSACGNNSSKDSGSSTASSGSDRKGKVYWLNFKPEIDEVLQGLGKDYQAKYPNVNVKIVTAASGTYQQTLTSEMDKSEAPTLFVIGNKAGVKQWGDYAMDLKDTAIVKEQNTDKYNLTDKDGKVVAIGYCYEDYGIGVNLDLLEKAGAKVDDIKDFDSLKKVVEDIHSRASELGFDAFVATDMDDSSSWRITGHLANLEYFYEERDDGGWDETPASIKGTYLPNYKNLYDLAINNSLVAPSTLATGGHDPLNQFIDGKAAFFFTGSFNYDKIAAKQKNVKCIPYYCGVKDEEKAGLCCGTENCWAINKNASDEDRQATMDFLMWLVTDADASKKLVDVLGIMPFSNVPEGSNKFLNDAKEYTDKGCYIMDWAVNYQPNVESYRASLVSALNAYNASPSDSTWDGVKTAFVDGWAQQYKKAQG